MIVSLIKYFEIVPDELDGLAEDLEEGTSARLLKITFFHFSWEMYDGGFFSISPDRSVNTVSCVISLPRFDPRL